MRIEGKNLFSWEHLEFEVEPGVTLIQGYNYDDQTPEGSGKSALLNTFSWTAYGEIPKDANIDDVIREGQKHCEGRIYHPDFTIGRDRGPNDLFIIKKGQTKPWRGKDARETQKEINKLLGMTFKTFCQCIYFPQNYPNKFVNANQEEKGKILSEILDLEQFDRARKVAADRIKVSKENLIIAQKDKEKFTTLLDSEKNNYESFRKLIEEFHAAKAVTIGKLFTQLESLNFEAENFVAEFEAAKAKDYEAMSEAGELAIKKHEAALDEFNRNNKTLSELNPEELAKEKTGWENDIKELEDYKNGLKVKLGTISETIRAQDKSRKELATKQQEIRTYIMNIKNKNLDIEGALSDLDHAREEYGLAESALNNPSKDKCPTCGQDWDGDPKHYQDAVDKAQKLVDRANATLKKYQTEYASMEKHVEALDAAIQELSTEVEAFEVPSSLELEKKIKNTEVALAEDRKGLKAIEDKLRERERLTFNQRSLLERIENAAASVERCRMELTKIHTRSPEKELEKYAERAKALEIQIEAEDAKEPESLQKKLQESQKKLQRLHGDADAVNLAVTNIEYEILQLEAVREGFKETKVYTFENTLNKLTRKANKYLSELFTQSVRIKFKNEDMKIECMVTIDGQDRPLAMYSGGQSRRITLAVDLALADITLDRKGNKFNMLILDEYFKDLSEVSMEKVLRILQARKTPTLLIEHNSLFKSIVDNTIEIELRDKVSRRVS